MTLARICMLALLLFASASSAPAQADDSEDLKLAALEALMSAPPDRALPILTRVLKGNASLELKERALFVLGQIDRPEAYALLLDTARNGKPELRESAIRGIGISGDARSIAGLADIYASSDRATRQAVLHAYLIADDEESVYQIAANTRDAEEFEAAVDMLGAMGATEKLRALRNRPEMADVLINAYAVAGDIESLSMLAHDDSNPDRQAQAIHGLGITGSDEVSGILVAIYRDSKSAKVRDAALQGLLIAGKDKPVLELYHASTNPDEKKQLLQTLVMMDSDAIWDVVDNALEKDK